MARALLVFLSLFALLSACTQRLACPAYQSSFIYDKEAMRQKFSYFKEDSTPKILMASKSKYLIAVPESYRKKYKRMQTVEMKPVYPKIPDSLKTNDEFLLAEHDEQDSAAVEKQKVEPGDSAYAITKTKEKYNLDQDLYMWYFREMLVLPDVRAALEDKSEKKTEEEPEKTGEKKKGGLFKNPFKKNKNDSTVVEPIVSPEEPKKKGGLFKKNKSDKPLKKQDPAKKKEDGDGF